MIGYFYKEGKAMASIIKAMHQFGYKFDRRAERFAFRHPYAAFLFMFIGMPLLILAAVIALTLLFLVPASLIF